jgi:hypothetical protein
MREKDRQDAKDARKAEESTGEVDDCVVGSRGRKPPGRQERDLWDLVALILASLASWRARLSF